jgi:nucleolar pre-ribosomal-associated protein 1
VHLELLIGVLQVLQMLQKRVLAAKAAVPAAAQAEVFSDATLQQLAAIATHAPALGEEEEAEEAEEAAEAAERRQAAAAAQAVLLAVATDPSHGLTLAAAAAAGPSFVLADAGSQQLQPGQRRLLRMLLRLRPADSAAHLQLLLAAVAGDAPLAAALLLALPYSLESAAAGTAAGSAAAGRWFAHTAVAARLLQLLPETAAPGLALRAANGGAAPPPGGRQAQALLRCCFPACLQKAALSRGLQHSNALVRHGTLALLISSMSVLEAVLGDCTAAATTGAAATSAGSEHSLLVPQQQGWLALRGWLQQAARQHLPDPTLLLALLAGAEKEGWENGE